MPAIASSSPLQRAHLAWGGWPAIAIVCLVLANVLPAVAQPTPAANPDATELVTHAFKAYRGLASIGTMEMTIHRPSWERTQTLKAWTRGERETLVTTLAPERDRGSGTLKLAGAMWIYNPKVNRVIKLPPSMMTQSWMGSDFSNNDLAKSDVLLTDFEHHIAGIEQRDGHTVYVVESIPHPGAAIVWGKERLLIRDDNAFLEEAFFDEDGALVKTLHFEDIRFVKGLPFAYTLTMQPADKPGRFTRIRYSDISFPDSLPDSVFTQSALRNPPD